MMRIVRELDKPTYLPTKYFQISLDGTDFAMSKMNILRMLELEVM
jgi:hypothetical protein